MSLGLMLGVAAGTGLVTLLLYALVAGAGKPARPPADLVGKCKENVFDVFERDGAKRALSSSRARDFWAGAIYCLFFYFAAPLLIWRYGVMNCLKYVGVPVVGAFALSLLLGFDGPWAILFGIPLRLAVGLWINSQSSLIRINRMVSAGWTHVGSCRTNRAATAIDAFFPSTSKPRRWYKATWKSERSSN